ncbi:MAG: glutaredoxin family protein [Acidobacteria bacterium]|nr:glutaredoxin family protein [Acidobacteriota bacterium]
MAESSAAARLQLLTRPDCHLCVAARAVVADVARESGTAWQEISIDTDATLAAKYAEEVPVVLVDGIQRDFWVIDPQRLRASLGASASAAGGLA